MRTYQTTVREGEDMGPIDWSHEMAASKSDDWREAEKRPEDFVYGEFGHAIIKLCMYDGWPYWKPTPAVFYIGPLKSGEWGFFNSYGASIRPNPARAVLNKVTQP